jgi:hypothetical protein
MRFSIIFAVIILMSSVPSAVIAQSSPEIGVWKLNLAKSKFYNLATPKSETRIVEPQGKGVKVHEVGVAGDGSPIDFAYSYTYSDNDEPSATGDVTVKRLTAHTFLGTSRRDGKIVGTTRVSISDGGNVMTFIESGTDDQGKQTGYTAVYDKQ